MRPAVAIGGLRRRPRWLAQVARQSTATARPANGVNDISAGSGCSSISRTSDAASCKPFSPTALASLLPKPR